MTHDELVQNIKMYGSHPTVWALLKIVELHSGTGVNNRCASCSHGNACETIQIIEKDLK